jgi:hypothetical protein
MPARLAHIGKIASVNPADGGMTAYFDGFGPGRRQ